MAALGIWSILTQKIDCSIFKYIQGNLRVLHFVIHDLGALFIVSVPINVELNYMGM